MNKKNWLSPTVKVLSTINTMTCDPNKVAGISDGDTTCNPVGSVPTS